MIRIFLSENNDRVEEESILRGCRTDVLVEIDGAYYAPYVTTLESLCQEVTDAFAKGVAYDTDPCQIIVRTSDKDNIIQSILFLYDEDYFDAFVPIDLTKTYQHTFPHLSRIENLDRIY